MKLFSTALLSLGVLGLFPGYASAQTDASPQQLLKELKGVLRCKVTAYSGTEEVQQNVFTGQEVITSSGRWKLRLQSLPVAGNANTLDVKLVFQLVEGSAPSSAVSASFDFSQWSPENYVMVPAVVYNGNRYRAIGNGYNPDYPKDMYYNPKVPLTISNNPRLSIDQEKASIVELQTGNTATPAMCFFSRKIQKGFIVLTEPQTKLGNNGLTIWENAKKDSCSFAISAPAVRRLATGFGDFHKSGDSAPDWKAGDEVTLNFRVYAFNAKAIPDLLAKYIQVRKEVTGANHPRNQLPMSRLFEEATTICSNNFVTVPAGSYYLPENNKDFQLGWVSGMMNSYPMLALNNEKNASAWRQNWILW